MLLKNKIIRTLAVIICILAVLSASVLPCFAAGLTDGADTLSMYSYWNLRYLTVMYTDGDIAMFEFPNVFYSGRLQEQTIVLKNEDNTRELFMDISTNVNVTGAYNEVAVTFDLTGISQLRFHFVDSVIKSFPGSVPSLGDDTSVYLPYFIIEPGLVTSLTGNYNDVRPVTSLPGYDFKFADYVGSWNGLIPSDYVSGVYTLAVPESDYSVLLDFYELQGYSSADIWPYFPEIITTLNIRQDSDLSNLISIYLPLSNTTSNVYADSNFVAQYYKKYYQGVPMSQEGAYNVDFTSWIVTAVGGFLSFQFMPGVSFGVLLLFVFGVAAFVYFLKLFAGG